MEENEAVEMEAEVDDGDLNAFDESWDDDASFDEFGSADSEEDSRPDEGTQDDAQVTETDDDSGEDAGEPAPEPGNQAEEGNQLFKINYLGKEEELTLEQITELAQKGRDYDHVRQERDKLRGENTRNQSFLQKLADKAGVSIEDQIDLTEAMWLMDEEADKGNVLTEAEALLRVQKKRNEPEQPEPEKEQSGQQDFTPQIKRFLSVYPNVQASDIPKEVWDMAMQMGGDLLGAYQAHEIKMLRAEKAQAQQNSKVVNQNNKNKNRSTGPRESAGANRQIDSFDEGWDS